MRPGDKKCSFCGQSGHLFTECMMEAKQKEGEFDEKSKKEIKVNFQYIRLSVLREYLDMEVNT